MDTDKPAGRTRPIDLRGAAPIIWQAKWLKDSLFEAAEYREIHHPDRTPANNSTIQNVHTLFRRTFSLRSAPVSSARLYLSADDCYRLYVNGSFVGVGPAPSYPFAQPYNGWDVTDVLQAGRVNCLGIHVYYQGLHNLAYVSADNLQGVLAQLEIAYADGASAVIATDGAWRCLRCMAYRGTRTYGYETQFAEDIDLRQWPWDWNLAGFDDGQWPRPVVCPELPPQYTLVPQRTLPVEYEHVRPVRVARKGPGRYFLDFGSEIVGETAFEVTGPAGHRVEVRHGEELSGPDEVRYDMRANCCYQEFCTLSGRRDERLEFFDYKGFRYVEVLNWPGALSPERVWVQARHYPFPPGASAFRSSDRLANDIWALCANGVKWGTLDTYLDCPTREKGGFLGDGFVTGQSHLILTGGDAMLRKFLQDVANSSRRFAGLLSVAPANLTGGELAEYSFLMPELLEFYYRWTGDLDFVKALLPTMLGMLDYYRQYANDEGLLQSLFSRTSGRYSVLVDWPKNLRDDYDDPALGTVNGPGAPINTVANAFYYGSLMASARLAEVAGGSEEQSRLTGLARQVGRSMVRRLRDGTSGLFVDRAGSTHCSLHASAIMLKVGLVPPADLAAVVSLLRQKRLNCGVYFSYFVLKGLYASGHSQLAYDLITARDEHSWHTMLKAGATTCMEAWGPDQKWNTSWCHPWSSAPISMIATELMGLTPALPGWRRIRFGPQPPAELEWAEATITTPCGPASARFDQRGDAIIYRLDVPRGSEAECVFVGVRPEVQVDGRPAPCAIEEDAYGVKRVRLSHVLGPGSHELRVARDRLAAAGRQG